MSYRCVVLAGLAPLAAAVLAAQGVPTSQPRLLHITREIEKPNHGVAHEATEARWADFNRRSGYPAAYFGFVSASGAPEMWWFSSFDNLDAMGKTSAFGSDNPPYTQGLARLQAEDADHTSGLVVMHARGVPQASHGAFPEIAKQRVYSIMTVRVRPGYDNVFDEIHSHYKMIAESNPAIAGWRSYQVLSGAPDGTYLVFSSFPSWAAVDANEEAWGRIGEGATTHFEAASKLEREGVISAETRYFTVNPRISVVPKEMAAADPFWAPKPAPVVKKP